MSKVEQEVFEDFGDRRFLPQLEGRPVLGSEENQDLVERLVRLRKELAVLHREVVSFRGKSEWGEEKRKLIVFGSQQEAVLTERLVVGNRGLVYKIVSCRFPYLSDREDLLAAGFEGLIKAVKTYKPGKANLATYAWTCIVREMIICLGKLTGVSPRDQRRGAAIRRRAEKIAQRDREDPFLVEERLWEGLRRKLGRDLRSEEPVSLDVPVGSLRHGAMEEMGFLGDLLPAEEEPDGWGETLGLVDLSFLPEEWALVLKLRYGLLASEEEEKAKVGEVEVKAPGGGTAGRKKGSKGPGFSGPTSKKGERCTSGLMSLEAVAARLPARKVLIKEAGVKRVEEKLLTREGVRQIETKALRALAFFLVAKNFLKFLPADFLDEEEADFVQKVLAAGWGIWERKDEELTPEEGEKWRPQKEYRQLAKRVEEKLLIWLKGPEGRKVMGF